MAAGETDRANGESWGRPNEPMSLGLLMARDYYACGLCRVKETIRHCFADRIEEKLPRLDFPVLIMRGGRDPVTTHRWAEETAELLPKGELRVIPGRGHAVNYSAPLEFSRVAKAFLNLNSI
jgi:2-hydroxy-6-oxonona-2,4-dienedioate hydrolase